MAWLTTTGVVSAFGIFLDHLCEALGKNEVSASSSLAHSATLSTATTSGSETSTFIPTNTDDTPDSSTSGGLSPGAKGGIAAGVIVAVLLLVVGFLLGRRYPRRRHADPAAAAESETGNKPGFAELDGKVGHTGTISNEENEPHIAELDSGPARSGYPTRLSELDGTKALGELHAIESISMLGDTPTVGSSYAPARG